MVTPNEAGINQRLKESLNPWYILVRWFRAYVGYHSIRVLGFTALNNPEP